MVNHAVPTEKLCMPFASPPGGGEGLHNQISKSLLQICLLVKRLNQKRTPTEIEFLKP